MAADEAGSAAERAVLTAGALLALPHVAFGASYDIVKEAVSCMTTILE